MKEFIERFMNKDVIVYTMNESAGSIEGKITEYNDSWIIIVDSFGKEQLINGEYIIRIREYPTNKNGKKKAVVLD